MTLRALNLSVLCILPLESGFSVVVRDLLVPDQNLDVIEGEQPTFASAEAPDHRMSGLLSYMTYWDQVPLFG